MIDSSLIFDGSVSVSPPTGVAITTTRVSTNIIDLLTARDEGAAEPLAIHAQIMTAFTAGGAATLQVSLGVCATTNGTYLQIMNSPIYPVAQLQVGTPIFAYRLAKNQLLNAVAGVLNAPGRYLQMTYTVATGPMTAGSIFSYITPGLDRQAFYTYPSNYSVYIPAGEI